MHVLVTTNNKTYPHKDVKGWHIDENGRLHIKRHDTPEGKPGGNTASYNNDVWDLVNEAGDTPTGNSTGPHHHFESIDGIGYAKKGDPIGTVTKRDHRFEHTD